MKRKNSNIGKINVNSLIEAFRKVNYNIKNISEPELEDHLRMFKLQIQNKEYERAESRVFKKFESLLNELWRLKKEEKNKLANNLLLLIKNTLSIEYEDHYMKYNKNLNKKYEILSNISEGDKINIIKPVWIKKDKIIIKGKAEKEEKE